jgi:hypothetical protein
MSLTTDKRLIQFTDIDKANDFMSRNNYGIYSEENGVYFLARLDEKTLPLNTGKTPSCKMVLQLMDKDYSYSEALKIALDLNFETSKNDLEKELEIYI